MLRKNWPLLVAGGAFVAGLVIYWSLKWPGLNIGVKLSDVGGKLAPLAFAAAVIERAVEVVISPWRDPQKTKLQAAVDAAKQKNAGLDEATAKLNEYTADTQKYAFTSSLILGLMASIAGVRAFWPFLPDMKVPDSPQGSFFLCIDVGLSAALLAGGADAVHSVVSAMTTFFDNASQPKP